MASRKTWVWVLVGVAVVVLVGLIGAAAAGVYFITRHITTEHSTSADAIRAFEAVRATFPDQKPLYELDSAERPIAPRPLADLPTSDRPPEHLWLLAWDPGDERLVKVALPFWMLRVKKPKVEFSSRDESFDLEHLNLDAEELTRIGPALVFDYRDHDGVRVLLWTQ